MFTGRRARSLLVTGVLGAVSLSGCGAGGATHAGAGQASPPSPAVTATTPAPVAGAVVTAQPGAPSDSATFSRPADVSNRMFPLVPGTQFVYRGKVIEEGTSKPHSVVFTVTDLVKVVNGVTSRTTAATYGISANTRRNTRTASLRARRVPGSRERAVPTVASTCWPGPGRAPGTARAWCRPSTSTTCPGLPAPASAPARVPGVSGMSW